MVSLRQVVNRQTFATLTSIAIHTIRRRAYAADAANNAARARVYEERAGHAPNGRVIRPLRTSVVARHDREALAWNANVRGIVSPAVSACEPRQTAPEGRKATSGGPRDRSAHLAYQKAYQAERATFGAMVGDARVFYASKGKADRVRRVLRDGRTSGFTQANLLTLADTAAAMPRASISAILDAHFVFVTGAK